MRNTFFKTVESFEFFVRAIVVRKDRIYSTHLRSEKDSFYAFFVKSMLKFDDGLIENARIVIDGSGDRAFKREMGAYFRRHLGEGRISRIRFNNSTTDRLIQLADMCAGAIARSYRTDRQNAARWRDMLKQKIENIWEFK